jgi:hypothetical protein
VSGDGTDWLTDLETLRFEGGTVLGGDTFALDLFTQVKSLSAGDFNSFVEMYIAYFNRAPDALGLFFWGSAFSQGTTLEQMAALFLTQPETAATYPPSLSNAAFVTAVYDNVLGRAPDEGGFDFWRNVLESGDVSRDTFILRVLGGAKAAPPADAVPSFVTQQLADRKFLSDKTELGIFYAVIQGLNDVDDAAAAMATFDSTESSKRAAKDMIDLFADEARDAENGAFVMQLVGLIENPFAEV